MTFEQKVRSMTASQLIQAMIDGLNAGYYTVDMSTFGLYREGTCFGCAATHAICHISGVRPTFSELGTRDSHYWVISVNDGTGFSFFAHIEDFFEYLRTGDIESANEILTDLGMSAQIVVDPSRPKMRGLHTDDWESGLPAFQRLADYNRSLELQQQEQ